MNNHCLAVALKMKKLAPSYGLNPEEMFTLGYVHEIAAALCEDSSEVQIKSGALLQMTGYKYWREVYNHNAADAIYDSKALMLLNYCNVTTSASGEEQSVLNWLGCMMKTYGEDSQEFKNASGLAEKIVDQLVVLSQQVDDK